MLERMDAERLFPRPIIFLLRFLFIYTQRLCIVAFEREPTSTNLYTYGHACIYRTILSYIYCGYIWEIYGFNNRFFFNGSELKNKELLFKKYLKR